MRQRTELDGILTEIMGYGEASDSHVYFQPPESFKMHYPCIIYSLGSERLLHADNQHYARFKRYDLTLIDKDPDSIYYDRIDALPYCVFDRYYSSDNLNHFVFTLYF